MTWTTCNRSCCWTPHSVCAKARACRCHPKAAKPDETPQETLDHADHLNNTRNPHIE